MNIPASVIQNWYIGHKSKNPNLPWVHAFEAAYSFLLYEDDEQDEEDTPHGASDFDILLPENWPQYVKQIKSVGSGISAWAT